MTNKPTRPSLIEPNPWTALKQFTSARIALGRVGSSLPTDEILRFGLAHAAARDAVHAPLDFAALERELTIANFASLRVESCVSDRHTYLLRPDLGRELRAECRATLTSLAPHTRDTVFVIADGLSAFAVQRHAVPLLVALRGLLPDTFEIPPIILAHQGRVALGDAIGEALSARCVVMLIGERPGLSSPDSLGVYLTYAPKIGRNDAERNCISNIRPEGLPYVAAARKVNWLLQTSLRLALSGVALKDESELLE